MCVCVQLLMADVDNFSIQGVVIEIESLNSAKVVGSLNMLNK